MRAWPVPESTAARFAAAVIIPPGFSRGMVPRFSFGEDGRLRTQSVNDAGAVEVYANNGTPITARIVHSVVSGIVNQFVRVNVASSATLETSVNAFLDNLDFRNPDLRGLGLPGPLAALQNLDASVIEPLGCLITPGASNITVRQRPLDALQEAPLFARIIVPIGASQAVFFALFTGVFGIQSIYEERRQWTLQRLIVSPTPRIYLLLGKLMGNLVVVLLQLLILLAALTLIASIVIGEPTLIFGSNLAAIVLVTLALTLCVSGLGVFGRRAGENAGAGRAVRPIGQHFACRPGRGIRLLSAGPDRAVFADLLGGGRLHETGQRPD